MTILDPHDDSLGTRDDFPITKKLVYLDNAFIAPMPLPVKAAASAWLDLRTEEETDIYALFRKTDETRALFAKFINALPEEIGFLYTTTESDNIIANALDLRPGDNIVTDDLAYPHTTVLGKKLEERFGIEFRIVPHRGGVVTVADFAPYVDDRTRLIVVPWVSNINGLRHDIKGLADLAHAHGAYISVDAIQIVGTELIDVKAESIDFLCAGTYKWLMSGWGIAPFYVCKKLLDKISPDRFGWQTAIDAPSASYEYTHRTSAKKFEYASPAFDQFQTLHAALNYLWTIGLDRIEAHSIRLIGHLRSGLDKMGFSIFTPEGNRGPNLTFWVGEGEAVVDQLFKSRGIRIGFATGERTSGTYGNNCNVSRVRISPAHYNTTQDIDIMLEVCNKLPRHIPA